MREHAAAAAIVRTCEAYAYSFRFCSSSLPGAIRARLAPARADRCGHGARVPVTSNMIAVTARRPATRLAAIKAFMRYRADAPNALEQIAQINAIPGKRRPQAHSPPDHGRGPCRARRARYVDAAGVGTGRCCTSALPGPARSELVGPTENVAATQSEHPGVRQGPARTQSSALKETVRDVQPGLRCAETTGDGRSSMLRIAMT